MQLVEDTYALLPATCHYTAYYLYPKYKCACVIYIQPTYVVICILIVLHAKIGIVQL